MFSSLVQPGVKMLQHICRGWRLWIWNGPVDFLFCSFRFRHSVVAQRHAGATFLANCSSNILPPHCSTCIIARQLSSQESSCAAHLKLCYAQTQKLGETRRFFVFLTFFFFYSTVGLSRGRYVAVTMTGTVMVFGAERLSFSI